MKKSTPATKDLLEMIFAISISLFSHDARRLYYQKDDKEHIVGGQGQGRLPVGHDAADKTEYKTPDETAGDTPQPPQDDHDDGDYRILETHSRLNREAHADKCATKTGHESAKAEAYSQHLVDIYPHEPGGLRILRRGPDGFSQAGTG